MSKFDDLLDEAAEAGLPQEWIDRFKEASGGSPLRKERDAAVERAEKAEAENQELRSDKLTDTLTKIGVKAKVGALQIPEDLDARDEDKVRAWAVEQGLAEPEPGAEDTELEAHERMEQAAAGAQGVQTGVLTPEQFAEWSPERMARFAKDHPEEAESLMRGQEVTGVRV